MVEGVSKLVDLAPDLEMSPQQVRQWAVEIADMRCPPGASAVAMVKYARTLVDYVTLSSAPEPAPAATKAAVVDPVPPAFGN